MAIAFRSINGEWQNWLPDPLSNEFVETVKRERRLLWGGGSDIRTSNGLGFIGGCPPIYTYEIGTRFLLGRIRYFNNQRHSGPDELELSVAFSLVRGSTNYTKVFKLYHSYANDAGYVEFEDEFPFDVELSNGVVIRLLGLATEPKPNDAPLFSVLEAPYKDTTTVYIIARLERTGPEPVECTEENAVFDVNKCDVPCVLPIANVPVIWDCEIPDPPMPIVDCPDIDIAGLSVPPPNNGLVPFVLVERSEKLDDFPKQAMRLDNGQLISVTTDPALQLRFGPAEAGFQGWAQPAATGDPCGAAAEYAIVSMQRFARFIQFDDVEFGVESKCIANVDDAGGWDGVPPSEQGWIVQVDALHLACQCLGQEVSGIAAFNDVQSRYPYLRYNVVDVDQMPRAAKVEDCAEEPCVRGDTVRTFLFGDGLLVDNPGCGSEAPCAVVVKWEGLAMQGVDCRKEASDEAEDWTKVAQLAVHAPLITEFENECPRRGTIKLPEDLITANQDGCLILKAEQTEDCKYEISGAVYIEFRQKNTDPCFSVSIEENHEHEEGDFCLFEITTESNLDISGGRCTTVQALGNCAYVIDSTIDIQAGRCIAVDVDQTGCIYTIDTTIDILPGRCIDVSTDKTGCKYTVTNMMHIAPITGGCIAVQSPKPEEWPNCTYKIGLDYSSYRQIEYVCDIEFGPITIECVEDENNPSGWGFSVTGPVVTIKKASFNLPSCLVSGLTSECGGGSSEDPYETNCQDCIAFFEGSSFKKFWYDPNQDLCIASDKLASTDPPGAIYCGETLDYETHALRSCTDLGGCTEGDRQIIEMFSGDGYCIEEAAELTAGCAECEPVPVCQEGDEECGIIFFRVSETAGDFPCAMFVFLNMPEGALSYNIEVIGEDGASAFIGPCSGEEAVPGETYVIPLDDENLIQTGERFTFLIEYRDAIGELGVPTGNIVARQVFVGYDEEQPFSSSSSL